MFLQQLCVLYTKAPRISSCSLLSLRQAGQAGQAGGGDGGGDGGGGDGGGDGARLLTSQLALVDLAGCEQLSQSRAVGLQLKEAVGINSSLLVLGKVINGARLQAPPPPPPPAHLNAHPNAPTRRRPDARAAALSEGRAHVPFHESRLTMLLRGAFGGNSRTVCCVTVSADDAHAHNSVQALRFGERCTTITNTARVAATSVSAALEAIDAALTACARDMLGLEARGKTELPAYKNLRAKHAQLHTRRQQMSAFAR